MPLNGSWTRINIEGGRYFIFAPSLTKLYLFQPTMKLGNPLKHLLGLKGLLYKDKIEDPGQNVAFNFSDFCNEPIVKTSFYIRQLYRLFHYGRYLPFRWKLRLLRMTSRKLKSPLSREDIGKITFALEQQTGIDSCYPRALITAWLCLRSGYSCEIVLGSLVPTPFMHAWCSMEGQIPYETFPEHFLYQPLLVITLHPSPKA